MILKRSSLKRGRLGGVKKKIDLGATKKYLKIKAASGEAA